MSQSTTLSGASTKASGKSIEVTTPEGHAGNQEFSKSKFLNWLVGDYEFDRYGIYAVALIVTGILAGIAVGIGAMSSALTISILIIPTMASLVMIIGVAPMRLLLWTVLITCLIDIIMIIAMLVV